MLAPLLAPESGMVIRRVVEKWPYSNAVAMRGISGTIWRMFHLDFPAVPLGPIQRGEQLGKIGSTGNSTGPHLHLSAIVNGKLDLETFHPVGGQQVDPLKLYARSYAQAAGYDWQVFERQINMESGWNPNVRSKAGALGIAQIIPRWHPAMEGRCFDPFASLEYAARLMASHLVYRDGDYREALADYNTGRGSTGAFRAEGHHYADVILKGLDMASAQELAAITADRDRNHRDKMGALTELGEVVQACNRAGEAAFSKSDWDAVKQAERYYNEPKAR